MAVTTIITARPADTFLHSVGVNIHGNYTDTVYAQQDRVVDALQWLGVRHYRDLLKARRGLSTHVLSRRLRDAGLMGSFVMDWDGRYEAGTPADQVAALTDPARLAGCADLLEGENERDFDGVGADDVDRHRRLHALVRSTPALAHLPLIGPSWARGVSSVPAWASATRGATQDGWNDHPYAGGHAPEAGATTGQAGEPLGSIAQRVTAATSRVAQPYYATECGYHDAVNGDGRGHHPISQRAAAAYLPRMFLEHFRLGVARSYAYELVDLKPEPGLVERERRFGLFNNDWTPKPSATALRALLAEVTDPAPAGAVERDVVVTVTGDDDLRVVPLTRDDGSLLLAAWRPIPLQKAGGANPAQLPDDPRDVRVDVEGFGSTGTVRVGAHPVVLALRPTTTAPPVVVTPDPEPDPTPQEPTVTTASATVVLDGRIYQGTLTAVDALDPVPEPDPEPPVVVDPPVPEPDPEPEPPVVTPPPTTTPPLVVVESLQREPVSAEALGIVGDGTTLVGTKLQAALDALKPGQMLHLSPGRVYNHSDARLIVRRDNTGLDGNGAVLLSNDYTRGGLRVDGEYTGWCKTGGVIRRLRHVITNGTTRTALNKDEGPLTGWRTSNMTVEDVQTEGSSCAGMFFARVTGLVNRNPVVNGSKADGIHHTDGTKQVLVVRPIVIKAGDDGVAIVSYFQDGTICEDITVLDPRVQKTYGGRGLTVVGGRRVRYYGGEVSETFAAGVLVACESSYNSFGVEDVKIVGTTLRDTNFKWPGERQDTPDHGAVLLQSAVTGRTVKDVDIKVKVISTDPARSTMGDRVSASVQNGALGTWSNVRVEATVEGLYAADATQANPRVNSQSANLGVTPRPTWDVRLGGRYAAAPTA